ncbi:MAG: hypothetical protein ABI811_04535 [Acidobacteriota bacterium]
MRKPLLWIVLVLLGNSAYGQWVNFPVPGTPRTRDGKPNLTAKTPRINGKPDLSGVWHVQPTSREEMKRLFGPDVDAIEVPGMEIDTISKYGVNVLQDFKPEEVTMHPAAAAIFGRRVNGPEVLPSTHCMPLGMPLVTLLSEVTKIVQSPAQIVMMLELDNAYRQIYLDGRKLPVDPSPSWLGYSVGKWEGDTLVVDTIGFNDKGWLDVLGHPQSESMHMRERYHRRDFGHMDVEITMDDPKMYSKPFSIKVTHLLQADTDILEYICTENEKDRPHMGLQ